jgi:protein TonB
MDASPLFSRLVLLIVFVVLPLRSIADDTVYTKVDINPVPVKTPPPDYPLTLKREGTAGLVAVSVVIDETGVVTSATVAKSSNSGFDEAAMDAVKKWKFKPAQKDGVPVKMKVTIPIRFSISD